MTAIFKEVNFYFQVGIGVFVVTWKKMGDRFLVTTDWQWDKQISYNSGLPCTIENSQMYLEMAMNDFPNNGSNTKTAKRIELLELCENRPETHSFIFEGTEFCGNAEEVIDLYIQVWPTVKFFIWLQQMGRDVKKFESNFSL